MWGKTVSTGNSNGNLFTYYILQWLPNYKTHFRSGAFAVLHILNVHKWDQEFLIVSTNWKFVLFYEWCDRVCCMIFPLKITCSIISYLLTSFRYLYGIIGSLIQTWVDLLLVFSKKRSIFSKQRSEFGVMMFCLYDTSRCVWWVNLVSALTLALKLREKPLPSIV